MGRKSKQQANAPGDPVADRIGAALAQLEHTIAVAQTVLGCRPQNEGTQTAATAAEREAGS